MSPMPHKNTFEPKDPRIINLYEDDEDEDELDDWSLSTTSDATPRPRRKKTGTQALVEFLNTTSPEEFEKKSSTSSSSTITTPPTTTNTTKRSSNLFFRRRNKNKPPTAPSSTSSTPTPSSASYLSSSSVTTATTFNRHDVIPSASSSSSATVAAGAAAPNTIHRKNYIEIIPNHILGNPNLASHANSSTSLSRVTSRTPSLASRHSTIRRSIISNSDQQSPVLPSNRNPATKQRESSLYSDSIRHSMSTKSHSLRGRPLMRHDTDATFGTKSSAASAAMIAAVQQQGRRPSEHTFGGQLEHHTPSSSSILGELTNTVTGATTQTDNVIHNQHQLEERDRKATELLVNHFSSQDDLETVESALLQRLERFKLSKMDKPSNVVAAGLATEHVRALQVSTQEYESFDPYHGIDHPDHLSKSKKKKIRHMQVQTMPLDLAAATTTTSTSTSLEPSISSNSTRSITNINNHASNTEVSSNNNNNMNSINSNNNNNNNEDPMIIQLQQQLAEEQKQRKRLEAALEETCDHFEVLSGMAYQKLRELWEERTRWENACIELRDRLLEMNHHQGLTSMEDLNDFPNSEYIIEEQVKEE
ncbi:hypothetical protein BDC45DRAFT_183954 [Circinella umbellata]|nr:hypothetical protein BDC45DRAFT_183954 [Circinella umbellata]